jgi:excisionase family DNA binding protein
MERTEATAPDLSPATLKVPQAAQIAGVGTAAIRTAIKKSGLPCIRFGRNILIPREAFLRWLDACGRSTGGVG